MPSRYQWQIIFPRTTFTADSLNFINFDELQKIDGKLKFYGNSSEVLSNKSGKFYIPTRNILPCALQVVK